MTATTCLRLATLIAVSIAALAACTKHVEPRKYPWCEWQGETTNGVPNGKGWGGCVAFIQPPHVPLRRIMREMPRHACDDESDECQCEKFWRSAVNGDYYIIYKGRYADGVRSGEGSYLYPDGSLYIGQWEADRRQGYGVLFDFDCKVVEQGDWCADEAGACNSNR